MDQFRGQSINTTGESALKLVQLLKGAKIQLRKEVKNYRLFIQTFVKVCDFEIYILLTVKPLWSPTPQMPLMNLLFES